ncbi:SP-RING zinc finger domain containing protein [Entamoeba histolytica HM-1:IMSS-B]|uniref:SP-RING zinc finger domain containing protein n=4 Tax=Entamoeba histolytica TaxID=5759 RepID=C4M514_ENTH1|nr:SP-RING zinc finger domain containing protein [Entamoeba histolytica HM-1:IMSS]EAL49211.1 SP-RING zinc finger domain containing protein [Entamoeba histolytica HM-1:IMSS]EMH76928.1 SP-RING zinc finger domain containing protein [Entamoeba histolytica HM-1:IMSS-B]ENY60407.1 SP-RING zinc finger domain containing protein [Entamoeba histolytica HM-1:IMSS-A]GAT96487.1 sp-ring zinc finger domain containing protein [Entamoeba histolytica]|eukprot:XP_654598.1 SP-RING zinc finger domain containing protein [Entamoeba histolytica HM-1:IMSS]
MKYLEWLQQNKETEIYKILKLNKEDYPFEYLFQESGEILNKETSKLISLRSYLFSIPMFHYLQPYSNFISLIDFGKYLCNELNKEVPSENSPQSITHQPLNTSLKRTSSTRSSLTVFIPIKKTVSSNSLEHDLDLLPNQEILPSKSYVTSVSEPNQVIPIKPKLPEIHHPIIMSLVDQLPVMFKETLLSYYTLSKVLYIIQPKQNFETVNIRQNAFIRVINNSGIDVSAYVTIDKTDYLFEQYNEKTKYKVIPYPIKNGIYKIKSNETIVIFTCNQENPSVITDRLINEINKEHRYTDKLVGDIINDGEMELEDRVVISLNCPFSKCRMNNPVKGKHCSHNFYMDAISLITSWKHKPWICCFCKQVCYWEDVELNIRLQEIIQKAPPSAEFVEIINGCVNYKDKNKNELLSTNDVIDVDSYPSIIDVDDIDNTDCTFNNNIENKQNLSDSTQSERKSIDNDCTITKIKSINTFHHSTPTEENFSFQYDCEDDYDYTSDETIENNPDKINF